MMKTVKMILAYIAAVLCTVVLVVVLMGSFGGGLDVWFASATGLTVTPWYSGGEVAQRIDHPGYQTQVHRPVFDALIGERRKGFVQVAWSPPEALPQHIDEEIDVDADGQVDFRIQLDTRTHQAVLTPYAVEVIELKDVYPLTESLAIRVLLSNPTR
jgi:hypothetical protein